MKKEFNMEQDWRINGQEAYLQNATLYKIKFPEFWKAAYKEKNAFYQKVLKCAESYAALYPDKSEYLEGEKIQLLWHDHCEFCWEKAMTDTECEFYCTKDMRYWICKECYEDFKDKFNWTVKSANQLFE